MPVTGGPAPRSLAESIPRVILPQRTIAPMARDSEGRPQNEPQWGRASEFRRIRGVSITLGRRARPEDRSRLVPSLPLHKQHRPELEGNGMLLTF